LPDFDEEGNLCKLASGEPRSIFTELIDAIQEEGMLVEHAIKVVTSNVADALKLKNKGRIREGLDADVVLLDPDFEIYHMVANGELMVENGIKIKLSLYGD